MNVQGTIEKINNAQLVTDKFQKRDFVLKIAENPDYPEFVSFEFIQDKCDLLDNFKVGQEVDLSFNLKGRSYEDKKTGATKYFNTLQAWSIRAADGKTANFTTSNNELVTAGDDSSSDLPF